MPKPRVALEASGQTVRDNVVRIRKSQGITLTQLSERLETLNHPISTSALSQIANGARRVDVDDLVALAIALNVSPVDLLMPQAGGPDELVRITGTQEPGPASVVREWMRSVHDRPVRNNLPRTVADNWYQKFGIPNEQFNPPPGLREYVAKVAREELQGDDGND